jgi:hypothetical protein
MTRRFAVSIACAAILVASIARADDEERHRAQIGGAIGWAFPAGSLEEGSRTSDETFGVTTFALDGAWRLHEKLSAGLLFQYGVVTPKLCATSSDCTSSLGRDVVLAPLVRWHLGRFGAFVPSLDAAIGYEWLSSKLSWKGVVSRRGHRGVFFGLDAFAGFALSRRVILGPTLGLAFGVADHSSIEAPGVDASHAVDGHALHLWPKLGARVVVEI